MSRIIFMSLLLISSAVCIAAPPEVVQGQANGAVGARNLNIENAFDTIQSSMDLDVTAAKDNTDQVSMNFKASATNNLRCQPLRGSNFGGVMIEPTNCTYNLAGDTIETITFQWCKRMLDGISCKINDWFGPVQASFTPVQFDDFSLVLLECLPNSQTCNAQLQQNSLNSYNETDMDSATVNSAGNDSQLTQINQTSSSVEYQTNVNTNMQSTSDCVATQLSSLEATGEMTDCSGNTQVVFNQPAAQCEPVQTCADTTQVVNTFNDSCFSNVPTAIVNCNNQVPVTDCATNLQTGDHTCQSDLLIDTQVCAKSRNVTNQICNRALNITVDANTTCNPVLQTFYWATGGSDRGFLSFECDPYRVDGLIKIGVWARGGNNNCFSSPWVYRDIDLSVTYSEYEVGWVCVNWGGNNIWVKINLWGGCNGLTCTYSTRYYSPDNGQALWISDVSFEIPRVINYFISSETWDDQCAQYANCTLLSEACIDGPLTKTINNLDINRNCWEYTSEYACLGPEVNSCGQDPGPPWVLESSANYSYVVPNDSSTPWTYYEDYYTSNERWVLTCDNPTTDAYCGGDPNCDLTPLDCAVSTPQFCFDSAPTTRDPNSDGSQIYRSCWGQQTVWTCYNGNQNVACNNSTANCTYTGFQCVTEDPNKIPDPTYGTCVDWIDQYACTNDTVASCDGNTALGCTDPTVYATNTILGPVPIDYDTTQTCYAGGPIQCNNDPTCQLDTVVCNNYIDPPANTICSEQTQNYVCSDAIDQCTNMVTTNTCASVNTGDTDIVAYNNQSNFNAAVEAAAYAELLQRDIDVDGVNVSFFGGEANECKNITDAGKVFLVAFASAAAGIFGNEAQAYITWAGIQADLHCCKSNPDDVQTKEAFNLCDVEDVKLAAAIWAKRAHRIEGPYTLAEECLNPGPGANPCFHRPILQEGQTWCIFDSMLSRILQEQGREQLAELALSAAAGTSPYTLQFDFYGGSPGSWTAPVDFNGNQVRVWQWDTMCQDPATLSAAVRDASIVCPSQDMVFVALCSHPSGNCGPLPSDPRIMSGAGEWVVQPLLPRDQKTTALNRYVVANGGCAASGVNPEFLGQCSYDIKAWPAGQEGQLYTQINVDWQMYMGSAGYPTNSWATGTYEFQPYYYDMTLPKDQTTIDFNYRVMGTAWNTITLPLGISADAPIDLPGLPTPVSIYGECDKRLNRCSYTVLMVSMVNAKPWGTRNNPDCTGFSLDEIQVLDFDRMDLSEFTASLEIPVIPTNVELLNAAKSDVSTFYNDYNNNTPQEVSNPGEKVIQIQPSNGFAPFEVTIMTALKWPYRQNGVTNYLDVLNTTIDWGDGSPTSNPALTGLNQKMQAIHTYPQVAADTTYTVTVTFTTDSGTFAQTAEVLSWRQPPQADGTNSGGSTGGTTIYEPQALPGGATTGNTNIPTFVPNNAPPP